jgi:hypothetical protein
MTANHVTDSSGLFLEDNPCLHKPPTAREYAVGVLTLFSVACLLGAASVSNSAACRDSALSYSGAGGVQVAQR